MPRLTLRDIATTRGFSAALAEMVRHTLQGKEAGLICYNDARNDLVFAVSYGTCNRPIAIDDPLETYLNASGYEYRGALDDGARLLDLHTHPDIDEEPTFSKGDVLNAIGEAYEEGTVSGVIVLSEASRTRALLWRPGTNFSPGVMDELYNDLVAVEEEPREYLEVLRRYGRAEMVDFELRNGIWRPKRADLKKLGSFTFDTG